METMEKLEKMIMKELENIAKCDELNMKSLQCLDLLTHSLKSIKAVEKAEGSMPSNSMPSSIAGQSLR